MVPIDEPEVSPSSLGPYIDIDWPTRTQCSWKFSYLAIGTSLSAVSLKKAGLLALVSILIVNELGFCYRDLRFYSKKDLFKIFASAVISDPRNGVLGDLRTAEGFIAAYPSCCEIRPAPSELNWLFRIFGYGRWQISISYPRIVDNKNTIYSFIYDVDCCGSTWERWSG